MYGRYSLVRLLLLGSAALMPLCAEEGMWLFSDPPLEQMKSRFGFSASKEWLETLQKSSVRFNNGGSGSFVSADGLTMTNHHIALDCLQKLSTQGNDLLAKGFLAKARPDERACTDLELNVLMAISDVTSQVEAVVKPDMDAAAAQKARGAVINTIEKTASDKSGLRSDVVMLYNGGKYHLYQYKKYTDVRLVFAPEKDIAFFGGDPDNFEYPRYCFDVSFFRVYENNAPAKIQHYLKWSGKGAVEDELVFVSGHPGKTDRLNTLKHLEFARDVMQPLSLSVLRRREVDLIAWSGRTSENARRAADLLFGYQNARKAREGMLAGLQDPAVMLQKTKAETELREKVNASVELKAKYGSAWNEVDQALTTYRPLYKDFYALERPAGGFSSDLFLLARDLVRYADEKEKPNADRLREYSEAGLESLKQGLFSEAPIYKDLETIRLTDSFSMLVEWLGADHELVSKVLAGKSPRERASAIVNGSTLFEVANRKKLFEGGKAAVKASQDPMIQLAALVDPYGRAIRKTVEEKVEEPLTQAYGKIAQARFAAYGSNVYPDATFTLRFSYGTVKSYMEDGKKVASNTTMMGLYSRSADHQNRPPFNLPASWEQKRSSLDLNTPFNFISTNDIIGGNSGSPIVNKNNEIVGIIFDGNIQSLVLDYLYTDDQARALSVHSAGILEGLRKIYGAEGLAGELTRKN